MAILNKLRNSTWVLILVLVSLGLFVASDYFSSNKYNFGGGDEAVGEIDGKPIKYVDFDAKYNQLLEQLKTNTGGVESEELREQASTIAWNQFIQELVVDKEYAKLGIDVSPDEAGNLLYSNDAHPTIKQYFSRDGVFTPSDVINYKNQVAKKDPKAMAQFELVVKQIILEVQNRKYTSLIAKSIYATTLDAEDELASNTTNIKGKSVTLNYATIDDKTIKVTDDELKEYIKKHKEDYQQKPSRDLEYIMIDVTPTRQDTMTAKEEIAKLVPEFASTDNDSDYVAVNSIVPYDNTFKPHGSFNKDIESSLFAARKDSVIGPLYYDGSYSIFKVTDTKDDSIVYYHLIKADIPVKGTTKMDTADAMALGRKIAAESSSAPDALEFFKSKSNTGELSYAYDMNWVREGTQPAEFEKAMKTLGPGQATVVSSVYGLSILKLVEPKSSRLVKVAEVRQPILAQKQTSDDAFRKATTFRNSLKGEKDEFEAATKKANLAKGVANNVKEGDKTMSGIAGTRDVIRWAFNRDRKADDYSDVISSTDDNLLIVAHLVRIKKEGTAEVDDVREKVTKLVMNEKKAAILTEKFNTALKSAKTIEAVALGVKSAVMDINGLNFNSPNVQFTGNDVSLVGYVCGLKPHVLSKPVASADGVHVFWVESVNKTEMQVDMKYTKESMYMQKKSQLQNFIFETLKKSANVKDERYKFY